MKPPRYYPALDDEGLEDIADAEALRLAYRALRDHHIQVTTSLTELLAKERAMVEAHYRTLATIGRLVSETTGV